MTNSEYGEPRRYEAQFSGPARSRSCTDVLCLLVWVVFAAGWAAVAVLAYQRGEPSLLLHASDSAGRPCGAAGTTVSDQPYLNYFDISACGTNSLLVRGCATPQVCVERCPALTYDFRQYTDDNCRNVKQFFVCQLGVDTNMPCSALLQNNRCAQFVVKSTALLGRCIPNLSNSDVDANGMVKDQFGHGFIKVAALTTGAQQAGQMASALALDAFSDLQDSWWVIVAGCVAAALLSLLWVFLLRFLAAVLIWVAFFGCLGAALFGCVVTYMRYDRLKGVAGDGFNPLDAFTKGFDSLLDVPNTWLVLFLACCIVLVLLLLLLVVLYRRVRIATQMLQLASRAVTCSLSALLFPLVPCLLQLAVLALFVSVALYIASMGQANYVVTYLPDDCSCTGYSLDGSCSTGRLPDVCMTACAGARCTFTGFSRHSATPYLHAYNTFGLFWGLFFCSALGEMVLAGTFAAWYWTFDKEHELPTAPVLSSAGRTVRYHLGTLALGSFIIAIVRLARVALEYVARKTRANFDNMLSRVVVCTCRCCLWCLEKFVRFINRNAYILCAVYGTNFCVSAKDAFFLLMRNVLRVVAVDGTCDVVLLLGKLVVTALTTIAAFFFLNDRINIAGIDGLVPSIQHSWVPLFTVAVASFFVASVFFSVYTMAVDTIFICFLEDLERNDGSSQRPYFMSKNLMKVLGKKNKRPKSE